jgi:hypothetical protein
LGRLALFLGVDVPRMLFRQVAHRTDRHLNAIVFLELGGHLPKRHIGSEIPQPPL